MTFCSSAAADGSQLAGTLARSLIQTHREFRNIGHATTRICRLSKAGPRSFPGGFAAGNCAMRHAHRCAGAGRGSGRPRVTGVDAGDGTCERRGGAGTVFMDSRRRAFASARKTLGVPLDRAGRVAVERDLSIRTSGRFRRGRCAVRFRDYERASTAWRRTGRDSGPRRARARTIQRPLKNEAARTFYHNDKGAWRISVAARHCRYPWPPVLGPHRLARLGCSSTSRADRFPQSSSSVVPKYVWLAPVATIR